MIVGDGTVAFGSSGPLPIAKSEVPRRSDATV
jgi:hypothetical protein